MSGPIVVTPAVLREWELPSPGDGKESRGHLLVVAGTVTTPGAALLTAEAGLRAGAGKLTVATSGPTSAALGVALPEALVVPLACDADGNIAVDAAEEVVSTAGQADAVVLGPGTTDVQATIDLLAHVLPRLDVAVVVDATASAYIGRRPDGLHHLAGRAVLTLNPHELALTAHRSDRAVQDDPSGVAAELAAVTHAVVVCGGTSKHVAAPDGRRWVVEGGTPTLGVSGSGDVQAGIVGGLLARGAPPEQAAVWAAYVHARTGERLAAERGLVGSLAREQLVHVPAVLAEVG